ncbi:hypothetical protein KQX54_014345 [Cotesia glomerata]|uniref:Uncharacterized protein n=1 Tax=Cotesia glomerata TaxID=32391 RepID=A0AAV7HX66_COTGL|nr:hypothetical protein KQX54_014345 [Cotesia glomerata]
MNHFLKMSSASLSSQNDLKTKESDAFPTTCRPDVKDEVVPRTEPVLWAQGDRLLDPKRAYPSERSQRALAWMHNAPAIVIPSSKLAWGCELPMQEMPVRTSSPLDMSDSQMELKLKKQQVQIVVSVRFLCILLQLIETDDSDSDDSFPEPVTNDEHYNSDKEIDKNPENATQPPKR